MADGRIEYEVRADISKLDSDLSSANQKVIKSAEEAAEKQEKAQKEIVQAVKSANDDISKDTQQTQSEIEKIVKAANDEIESDSTKTQEAVTEAIKEQGDKAAQYHQQSTDEIVAQSKAAGQDIEESVSAVVSGVTEKIGRVAASIASIKTAVDITKSAITDAVAAESAFAKVKTLLADDTDFDSYYGAIKAASLSTGVDIADISESVYSAISASVDQNGAVDFAQNAVKLAKGGFTETATAVDVLTTAINAYDLEASDATKISDMLITTQNLGKTTVDELAQSMGQTIPIANNANTAFDDLAAQYAILTKNGVATAESGTKIKAMLSELSSAGTTVSDALLEISGKSFVELQSEGKNTAEILNMLSDYAEQSGVSLSDLFGSIEAGSAAITLVKDGGIDFCNVLKEMGNSAGAAEKAYETMADTTEERFNRLKNSLTIAVTEIGEKMLPTIEEFFDYIESNSDELSDIIAGVGEVLSGLLKVIIEVVEVAWEYKDAILAVVAAMAAYKTALAIYDKIKKLREETETASEAMKKLTSSMSSMKTATGLLAVAVTLLISYIVDLASTSGEAGKAIDELNDSMEKMKSNTEDAVRENKAEMTLIQDKVKRYEELRQQAELTSGEMNELKALSEDLLSVFGESVQVIDEDTGAYNDLSAALENYVKQKEAAIRIEAAEQNATTAQQNIEKAKAALEDLQNNRSWEDFAQSDYFKFGAAGYLKWMADLPAQEDELRSIIEQNQKIYDDSLAVISDAYQETADDIANKTDETTKKVISQYSNVQSAISDTKEKYDLLTSATEELNSVGALSVSTLQSIVNTYPALQDQVDAYISGLIDESELLAALSDAYDVDQQNYYKYLLVKMGYQEDYINAAFGSDDALIDYFANNYEIDLRNYKDYISRKQAIQEAYDSYVAGGISAYWTEEGGYTDAFMKLDNHAKSEISGIISEYQSAIADLGDFQSGGSQQFQADFAKIKERTYTALTAGTSSTSGNSGSSSSSSSSGNSGSSSSSSSSGNSGSSSSSSNSGSSGGQTINITSYIPTVWDDAVAANQKLIAGGVAATLVGNSKSGKLISGLTSNAAATVTAGAENTEATLNDVVKAIKGLEESSTELQCTVTAILKCDSVTLARQTIKGIKTIEKNEGKSPL